MSELVGVTHCHSHRSQIAERTAFAGFCTLSVVGHVIIRRCNDNDNDDAEALKSAVVKRVKSHGVTIIVTALVVECCCWLL